MSFGELFGVDRRADRADLRQREVEQRPLERRAGEDRERLALPDAAREQAVGEVLDALGRLGPGDLVPVVAVLDEVGGAVAMPRDGVAARAVAIVRSVLPWSGNLLVPVAGAGTAKPGQNEVFPNRPRSSCARPGTDP